MFRFVKPTLTMISLLSFTLVPPLGAGAHEPIFMMSHETPGKGAFDIHTEVFHERQGNEQSLEIEQELSYGLTQDLAVKLSIPFIRKEEDSTNEQAVRNGFSDPKLRFKWRFWKKDLPSKRYALAGAIQSTLPLGNSNGRLGRDQPILLTGLSHGREGIYWYYFVDARYLYAIEDNDAKPGDQLYLDIAYGRRSKLRGLEKTDIVFFVGLNYLHEKMDQTLGGVNPDSGGDFLFFSPEILVAPTNQIMLRGGVQIPIHQSRNGQQESKDIAVKGTFEFRF